jgi:outer membrane protein OmpA-like peptidoglycan-associated protein
MMSTLPDRNHPHSYATCAIFEDDNPNLLRWSFHILFVCIAALAARANDTIPPQQERIIIKYYQPPNQRQLNDFQSLVSAYLSAYVDRCAVLENHQIQLRRNRKQTLRELDGIVKGAIDFYDYQSLKKFSGFSEVVDMRLKSLSSIDFAKTEFASGAEDEAGALRMEQFYLQKELSDLKLLLNMEVGIFSESNLLVFSESEESIVDVDEMNQIIENNTEYDPNRPLDPIRVPMSDASIAMINLKDRTNVDGKGQPAPDSEVLAQLISLVLSNNAKLDSMQLQMNRLREDQLALWQAQQDEKNVAMQKQIDDLRDMLYTMVKSNTGDAIATTGDAGMINMTKVTVKNLPSNMSVYFDMSSVALNANAQLALAEIVDILAKSPDCTIMLTGCADKTGNASRNLVLSQQRATAVKHFLLQSGVSAERILTKYIGDQSWQDDGKSERRVMIEFVQSNP